MNEQHILQKSLRLRHEAFSTFATAINSAITLDEVGHLLAVHTKYVLDVYIIRLYYKFKLSELVLEVFRGQVQQIQMLVTDDPLAQLEQQILTEGLPIYLSRPGLSQVKELKGSIFDNERVQSLYSLPLELSSEHSLVITVASKELSPYEDPDFRFIRLIAGLLSSKLSQLLLLQSLEIKNDELAEVNDELHALNEEITRLNLFLEEKVTERTTALQLANQELNTIFYRTSHDFRRPLTTILGLANVARHIDDVGEMRQLFTYAEEAVGDLMRMMEKLKDLSHLAEDSVENLVSTDFEEILDRIIVRYSSLIKSKSIDIRMTNQLQLDFHAPEGLLYAILENLLENAILFSSENPRIEISLVRLEKAVVVQVQDNGQGIRADYLDKVFDMYTRANESTKGNGLGLYVVKKLTDRLHGQVGIKSELGLGTTVRLQFPLS